MFDTSEQPAVVSVNTCDPRHPALFQAVRATAEKQRLDWASISREYNRLDVKGIITMASSKVKRLSNVITVLEHKGLVKNQDFKVSRVTLDGKENDTRVFIVKLTEKKIA
jgi:hypothetical protein